ncbi:MAG TPA: HlyD family efflux transporter periplasmic adaptor subunit, partial [Candidatus Hydrogenedentes bacterium]|nr:HlyD family efflux transporter periplasmic adaptor subunit [Candidatus Hydrogenedentota bacterium]
KSLLDVKFALMDFEKYLGAVMAREIIRVVGLETVATDIMKNHEASMLADATDPAAALAEAPPFRRQAIDFTAYADPDRLGNGEAGQRVRKLEDDLVLAEKEVGLAQSKLQGTQRLFEKEFVTRDELENDEMALRRSEIALESARTSKELFIKYEFPKQAEKLLSDYEEALRKLERTRKQAVSQMAQAEAKLKSAEARFTLQTQRRKEIQEQIEKCTIRATTPGLVVYGARERRSWEEIRIEEGASVRERQGIITIPNTRQMTAKVKIHEAYIERIARGQQARIKVDAHPDRPLTGVVSRIGVLPDAQNRWMNPDLKVYDTTVTIDGTHEWLKPGLSAQVEIIVDRLDDVLQVPLQAVSEENGQRICYVAGGGGAERRVVQTGSFSDVFIEIKSGITAGDRVLLRAPSSGAERPAAVSDSEQEGRPRRREPAGERREEGGS